MRIDEGSPLPNIERRPAAADEDGLLASSPRPVPLNSDVMDEKIPLPALDARELVIPADERRVRLCEREDGTSARDYDMLPDGSLVFLFCAFSGGSRTACAALFPGTRSTYC